MTRNRLYLVLFLALLAGYSYLITSYFEFINNTHTLCIFKNATGIACPSCGTTRSVQQLLNGNIKQALLLNPIGVIIATIMVIVPLWLLYDVLLKKDTLHKSYNRTEIALKNKRVAIPLILLVLANWIWNIYKGL